MSWDSVVDTRRICCEQVVHNVDTLSTGCQAVSIFGIGIGTSKAIQTMLLMCQDSQTPKTHYESCGDDFTSKTTMISALILRMIINIVCGIDILVMTIVFSVSNA